MKIGNPRHLWLKGLLATGLFLSLLLLVQSAYTYYHVSRQLVTDQLTREADRQVLAVERGLRSSEASDAEQQKAALEEILQDNAAKIAWMRIIDMTAKAVIEVGTPTGPLPTVTNAPPVRPEGTRVPELRDTPDGQVLVSLLPLRLGGFRSGPRGAGAAPPGAGATPRETVAGPAGTGTALPGTGTALPGTSAGTPQAGVGTPPPAASQRPENGRSMNRPTGPPQGSPRMLEIALYLESASSVFTPLRHNLIVSILAALGLAAAMILIWVRFPRYVRGKQLEEELELARKVQADLLPPSKSELGGLDFAAACVPAWQVGGDFYDVFTTNRNHVAIVLGDVAGKGLSAALLMGMLHGALRSMRWLETPEDQEISWRQLNFLLSTRTAPERFASLFWGSYDRDAGIIRYVNAGHLPPVLMSHSGNGAYKISRLEEGGPILGVLPTASYKQGEVAVRPGDLLVLFSDGIVEADNASEEEFGEERLCGIIQENCTRPSTEILEEVLKQVRTYIRNVPPRDDMTLVVARIQ